MKALLYFFQARNLHDGDIRNPNLPLEIIGTLKGENSIKNFKQSLSKYKILY